PKLRRLRAVTPARHNWVDPASVFDHALYLAFGLDPLVGGVEFPPQPVRRPIQITERLVQRVLLRVCLGLLVFSGTLTLATDRGLGGRFGFAGVLASFFEVVPELVDAVFNSRDQVGDLRFWHRLSGRLPGSGSD